MNRRDACRALLGLGLWAALGAARAQRRRKPPPTWAELTPAQQEILAPLEADWENLEPGLRRSWIGVAKRYPKMTPRGQKNVQKRMRAWTNLTPQERNEAREIYRQMQKAQPAKRKELRKKWREYQREKRSKPAAPAPSESGQ